MNASRPAFRLTGWHVLAILTAFFGVTIAVDTLMMVDAYRTYPGEVSSQPYEDGLAWDSELDQQHAQAALGWRMTADMLPNGTIEIAAYDRAGAPVTFSRIDARIERPATEQGERSVTFVSSAPGVYRADPGWISGAWDLRLSAFSKGRRFDAERRLTAPLR